MTSVELWRPPPFIYIVIAIVIRTVTQVLFKYVAIGDSGASYYALFSSPLFYVLCLLFVLLTWAWQEALRHYKLSFAYPFTSVAFVTLLISSAIFFHEQISLTNIIGSFIIIIGVIIVAGADGKELS